MQNITTRHLFLMGGNILHAVIYQRVPIYICWNADGYSIDGVVTARGLSAAEVLRCIMALKDYRK